eukprot:362917-Chlamydomonas_euryale.AAC.1
MQQRWPQQHKAAAAGQGAGAAAGTSRSVARTAGQLSSATAPSAAKKGGRCAGITPPPPAWQNAPAASHQLLRALPLPPLLR